MNKTLFILFFTFFEIYFCFGQNEIPLFTKYTTAEARAKTYNYYVQISINKNLSLSLTDSTEDNWSDAFGTMEYLHYHTPFTDSKIPIAFRSIDKRSIGFQKSFLELLYAMYPSSYNNEVLKVLKQTKNAKVFAMSAEYLNNNKKNNFRSVIQQNIDIRFKNDTTYIIAALQKSLNKISVQQFEERSKSFHFGDIFKKDYLLHNTIVYSLQSSDRNYPGIAIIKDTSGNFVTDPNGQLFSVPQLARSNSDMPDYITNGNTPQGLFRLYGFDVSKSMAIGPTENLQLTMPYETSVQHFLKDSSITDTKWTSSFYKKLLPQSWQDYEPLMGSFYASKIGRTEIISHGTTVDPEYYKGLSYYPQTPTQGCLCTKEIWDANGKRSSSDQQKLVDAVKKAGGADGYIIVLEIGDIHHALSLNNVLPLLKN